jgi:hypothetical protein
MVRKDEIVYHTRLGRGIVAKVNYATNIASVMFDCDGFTKKGKKMKRGVHLTALKKDFKPIKPGWDGTIDQLLNKEMITVDQSESLSNMLESSDTESNNVGKEILSVKVETALKEVLNSDQINAFDNIMQYLNDETTPEAFVLKGYAGTGKTFLISRIIEYLGIVKRGYQIAVTAPTNKAVNVLKNNRGADGVFQRDGHINSQIRYATIHKLLGLREQISADGEQIFVTDKTSKNALSGYKLVIVDETSMLDDLLFKQIMEYGDKVKIIFMGDPAQIPPVNATDPIPFKDDHDFEFEIAELNQIMRQKGEHAIVDHSFIIRDNLTVASPLPKLKTTIRNDGQGLIYLDSNIDRSKIVPLLNKYFNNNTFANDPDYMKVIAWRNVTVNNMNNVVRKLIYGKDVKTFEKGDKMIANNPIFDLESSEKVLFVTSQELIIVNISTKYVQYYIQGETLNARVYVLEVKVSKRKGGKSYIIQVIHEDSKKKYLLLLDILKQRAIGSRSVKLWKDFYEAKKWSANLGYNYAITAHKAQGSSYENVLILENDLNLNSNIVERNRIKYTSYTRASNKLFIYRK